MRSLTPRRSSPALPLLLRLLLLAAGAAARPSRSWAAPPPVIRTEPIVVEARPEARSADRAVEHTSSTTVVPGAIDRVAPGITGWLEDLEGVRIRRTGGPGQAAGIGLRGADGQQTLVLFDGIPLASSLGGGADLSLLPAAGLGSVEVLRGGLSDRAGSDALGGIVRIRSRPPPIGTEVEAGFGLGNLSASAELDLGAGDRRLGGRLVLSVLGVPAIFDFEDDAGRDRSRENAGLGRVSLLGRARWRPPGAGRFDLSYLGVGLVRGIPGVAEFPTPSARQEATTGLLSLRWRSPRLGIASLAVKLGHRLERSRFRDPAPPFRGPTEQRALTQTGYLGLSLGLDPHPDHHLDLDLDGQVDVAEVATEDGGGLQVHELRGAVALQETWSLGDLGLNLGLRVERWRDRPVQLAPRAGLRWQPSSSFILRAGGGRAYRIPTLSERLLDLGAVRGSPDLSPEVGWSADLSAELRLEAFELRVTPYYARYARTILFLPTSLFVVEAQNARDASVLGVEVWLGWRLGRGQRLLGTYTWARGRFDDPDVPLPGRPEHLGSLSWRGQVGKLEHRVTARYRSGITLDRFGSLKEEGHFGLDLGLALHLEPLELALRVDNLLDDRRAVDHLQQPLPGRTVFATVRLYGGDG